MGTDSAPYTQRARVCADAELALVKARFAYTRAIARYSACDHVRLRVGKRAECLWKGRGTMATEAIPVHSTPIIKMPLLSASSPLMAVRESQHESQK